MNEVDQGAFRRAAGQFASGIVVVTTATGHAMTVSAFASVSLDPPLVLFCAEKIARFHDAVLQASSWAVSILAEDDEKTARWLATGAPVLDDALAYLECRTAAVHDGGDHSIIVGRVTGVGGPRDPAGRGNPTGPWDSADPDWPRNLPWSGPLVHYSGAYRRLEPLDPADP